MDALKIYILLIPVLLEVGGLLDALVNDVSLYQSGEVGGVHRVHLHAFSTSCVFGGGSHGAWARLHLPSGDCASLCVRGDLRGGVVRHRGRPPLFGPWLPRQFHRRCDSCRGSMPHPDGHRSSWSVEAAIAAGRNQQRAQLQQLPHEGGANSSCPPPDVQHVIIIDPPPRRSAGLPAPNDGPTTRTICIKPARRQLAGVPRRLRSAAAPRSRPPYGGSVLPCAVGPSGAMCHACKIIPVATCVVELQSSWMPVNCSFVGATSAQAMCMFPSVRRHAASGPRPCKSAACFLRFEGMWPVTGALFRSVNWGQKHCIRISVVFCLYLVKIV